MTAANMSAVPGLSVSVDPNGQYVAQPTAGPSGEVTIRELSRAGTDRSTTATTTSSQLMGANTTRLKFYVKNDSTIDVWINLGATAVATAGGGNIKIPANGGYFELSGYSGAVNIIAASTTAAISSREL
jgi:hypothetical protein